MHTTRRLPFIPAFIFLVMVQLAYAQTPLRLVSVAPCRLVDTRPQNGGGGPIQGGTFQTFNLPSLAEVGKFCPAFDLSSAAAYSLNVTLVPVQNGPVGYLTIWPTGESRPLVSLMNSLDGRIKANAAIVPAGTNGGVNVYVTNTTNVLLDINAYFDSAGNNSALAFFPLTPCRVVDTRFGNGGPLPGGVERDFSIPGTCQIPGNAQAYSFNFTVVPINGGPVSYLTVWPAGGSRPVVSTLNDLTGTIVANAVIVPAGTQQQTAVFATNNTNLLIDVNGYFAPANSGPNPLSLYTLVPCRVLDTRKTIGLFNGTIPVGVVGSSCGIPNVAQGFVLNATVVPLVDLGYLTLWPEGQSKPVVSTLNALDGAITSNMAIVPAGAGNDSIDAFADANTQLVLDISSYFGPIANVSVLTSALPDGTVNQGYSVQLVAAGGVAPYTWTITSGSLPPGMNPLSPGGLISGTPNSTGKFSFTVQATDAQSNFAIAQLSITVNETAGALAISTTSLPAGTVNTPYNSLLAANGGITPYTWSIASGSLPTGLSLNSSTGLISGTPGAAGLTGFSVKVTDAQSNTATQPLSLTVNSGDANGSLNGTYAFSWSGYFQSNPLVVAGSFVANGNGMITGGIFDLNSSAGVQTQVPITSGVYQIDSTGLGSITITSTFGSYGFLIAPGTAEDMRIIGYNSNGSQGAWGSGFVRQQNPSDLNFAALAGNWAFGFQGFDPTHPVAGVGTYQQDSKGNITNGAEVVNDFGSTAPITFTGNPVGGIDANGRETAQIRLNNGSTVNVAVYVVTANQLVLIGIDNGGYLDTGVILRQSGTFNDGTLNGISVFRGLRQSHAKGTPYSDAIVGLITTNGTGSNVTILQDENNNGTIFHGLMQQGTYSVASNGGTVFNLADGSSLYCYLVGQNQGFLINTGSGANLVYFEPQSGGPFSNSSWSGEFLGGTLPLAIPTVFDQVDSISIDGAGNFSSTYDQSGPNGTNLNQTLSATYSIDSTGEITISQSGNPIYYGFVVSPTKVELISLDGNPRTSIETRSSVPKHH